MAALNLANDTIEDRRKYCFHENTDLPHWQYAMRPVLNGTTQIRR